MKSRTEDGKHTKRFIVQFKSKSLNGKQYYRSGNAGISGSFSTREEAQAAVAEYGSPGVDYKIRQK